jgi:hypothetical protein
MAVKRNSESVVTVHPCAANTWRHSRTLNKAHRHAGDVKMLNSTKIVLVALRATLSQTFFLFFDEHEFALTNMSFSGIACSLDGSME